MTDRSQRQTTGETSVSRPSSHSWAEVDLGAVRHNVKAVKKLLGPRCHLWAVVKADAYGHGAEEVAAAALAAGADGLAVSCLNEASELRVEAKIAAPLLVLAPGEERAASWIVRLDIVQTACVPAVVEALSRAAQRLAKPARVHVKVDTGMGRLGVAPEEVAEFAGYAGGLPGIALEGVFSHLATAEAGDDSYVRLQFERFEAAMAGLEPLGVDCGMRHIANSAAALRFPEMRLDGVRIGLLVYGLDPEAPGSEAIDLRPAMEWKTRLSFLHEAAEGSTISYGQTFATQRDSVVGVLPVGYADGYPRLASNRAHVLLRGKRCPVIGVVCMDHMMIDATEVPEAKIDDEVILLGRQGKERISANQLAAWAGTVVHEVPTVIGRRVKRVYCDREQPFDPDLVSEEPP